MRNLDDLYAKVHKNRRDEQPNADEKTPTGDKHRSLSPVLDSDRRDHNYETLKKSRKLSDPGYEKIRSGDEPGYESITGSDPGYEVLKGRESDPDYEQLRHRTSNASDCAGYSRIREVTGADGYSVVNKRRKETPRLAAAPDEDVGDEPNYESMPSEICGANGSESDPNYESVSQNDPNYESVKDMEEPPYERLDEDSSRTNSDVSGYEKIRKKGEGLKKF